MNTRFAAAAAAMLFTATSASAATYTGSHALAGGTVNMSVTTDDTIGALTTANIVDWSITVDLGGGGYTMTSANSGLTYLSGTAFQATATQLLFDFEGNGHLQWDTFAFGKSNALCMTAASAAFTCTGPFKSEAGVENGNLVTAARSGQFVLGEVSSSGVPEPATWALMILGFGAVGGAMRRRQSVATKVRFA